MPKFAANLTMMFNEWDFLDRFAAAADAGFTAVEFLFPMRHAPDDIAIRLDRSRLTQALFNMRPATGMQAAARMASIPGREDEFRASVETALTYARGHGREALHVLSGHATAMTLRRGETFDNSLRHACAAAAPLGIDILIEPFNGRDMRAIS